MRNPFFLQLNVYVCTIPSQIKKVKLKKKKFYVIKINYKKYFLFSSLDIRKKDIFIGKSLIKILTRLKLLSVLNLLG